MAQGSIIERSRPVVDAAGKPVLDAGGKPVLEQTGSYRVAVSYVDGTGKRHQVVKTAHSKREAARVRNDLLAQADKGALRKAGKETVAGFLTTWLRSYAKPRLTPRSYDRYASICRVHIAPEIGAVPLTRLEPEHLQRLYTAKLETGLAPRTVRYIHVVTHKALNVAVKWGKVQRNVADGADPPKGQRTDMQVWNEREISRFLDAARSTPYHPLFYSALYTGARRGELLALRWQDVDLVTDRLSVSRTLTQIGKDFVFGQPKSEKSRRSIALPPSAALLLRQLRESTEHIRARLGMALTEDQLVFSHAPDGHAPLRPNTVSRAWETTCRKAGVKAIRFHDARHTHASLLLKQNVPLKVISERLGHSTIAVTADIYSHVLPGMQESAAARFDAALNGTYNEMAVSEK